MINILSSAELNKIDGGANRVLLVKPLQALGVLCTALWRQGRRYGRMHNQISDKPALSHYLQEKSLGK